MRVGFRRSSRFNHLGFCFVFDKPIKSVLTMSLFVKQSVHDIGDFSDFVPAMISAVRQVDELHRPEYRTSHVWSSVSTGVRLPFL